jgi:hypothetical protein
VPFTRNDTLRGARTIENVRLDISAIDYPLAAVYAHWDEVRGPHIAPSLKEFRLEELPSSVVPFTTIVDFEGPPFDYRYRFFGTEVVQVAGMELTGKRYNADMIEGFGFANAEVFPDMVETPVPVVTRTTWLSVKSLQYVATTLRLPLAADHNTVSGGVTVYKFH